MENSGVSYVTTKSVLRVVYETESGGEFTLDIEDPKADLELTDLTALHTAVLAICGLDDLEEMSSDPVEGFKEAFYLEVQKGTFDE